MSLSLTLCIPTMDRYDTFLKNFIPKYIDIPSISEIIITDENGNDVQKIIENGLHPKLKLFKNSQRLGPFLNKYNACLHAKNDWIVLMDSDNFADNTYFEAAIKFIEDNKLQPSQTILMPSFARPLHDYRTLPPIIKKNNITKLQAYEASKCFNTGNYILSKDLIDGLNLKNDAKLVQFSSSIDVLFFNTLLIEQFPNLTFYIVPDMQYEHATHDGSIYIQTHRQFAQFNNYATQRFLSYFN